MIYSPTVRRPPDIISSTDFIRSPPDLRRSPPALSHAAHALAHVPPRSLRPAPERTVIPSRKGLKPFRCFLPFPILPKNSAPFRLGIRPAGFALHSPPATSVPVDCRSATFLLHHSRRGGHYHASRFPVNRFLSFPGRLPSPELHLWTFALSGGFSKKSLAITYFPAPRGRSIIGVGGLDFRVRNGNGYVSSTIITRH